MKNLDDVKLKDLLPDSIAKDGNVEASAEAIDPQLKAIAGKTDIPSIYVAIDSLVSVALNHLAMQYDVEPWRDSWNVTLKRSVLKNAIANKRKKGTRSAVVAALESLGSAAQIVEWFEENPKGEPHTFTVYATQPDFDGVITAEMQEDLLIMLDDAKPLRSHYNFVLQDNFRADIGVFGFARTTTYARIPAQGTSEDILFSANSLTKNDNANVYGGVLKFSTFGILGVSAQIKSLTLYRRANNTPNGATPLYIRILKKVGKAWIVAAQSKNAIAFNTITINGDPIGAFNMQSIENVSPLTPSDVLAIVAVSDPNAAAYSSLQFGCKVDNTLGSSSGGGALISALQADATNFTYSDYMPVMDMKYIPYGGSAQMVQALAKIQEWKAYLNEMQSAVDAEMSQAIAEEFERAAVEYLADPTATKNWNVTKGADGSWVSDNPYYLESPNRPVIDFSVTVAKGWTNTRGSFHHPTISVPIFLPNLIGANNMLYNADLFNHPIVLPRVSDASAIFINANAFNQPLSLPKATDCGRMLNGATSFNQPLSLPNAKKCSYMLLKAHAFCSTLDLPKATDCSYLIGDNPIYNLRLSLPSATTFERGLFNAQSFNNVVELPSCSNAIYAFSYTKMSAANIAATLNSLPTWTDGNTHTITFTDTPGIASTATDETFTVTDENGTEYSLANCPIFDTDDEAQTLRKAFVLAVVKKGWTVTGSVYSNTAVAMAFGLDDEMGGVPMWYRIEESEYGDVKDANGVRYTLIECGSVFTPQGENVGYTQFPSREACLEAWNLTELTEEEMFPSMELPEEIIDLTTEEEQI